MFTGAVVVARNTVLSCVEAAMVRLSRDLQREMKQEGWREKDEDNGITPSGNSLGPKGGEDLDARHRLPH